VLELPLARVMKKSGWSQVLPLKKASGRLCKSGPKFVPIADLARNMSKKRRTLHIGFVEFVRFFFIRSPTLRFFAPLAKTIEWFKKFLTTKREREYEN
jgi:hypothetical protein